MRVIDLVCNIPAFGIYNQAHAGSVLHCTYDPDSNSYSYEYTYMLIDYYNFSFLDCFNDMNVLGLAQSFELIGMTYGVGISGANEGIHLC